MKLRLFKFAASPVPPLEAKPTFKNELLNTKDWVQDVKWLRDTYSDIVYLWEGLKDPEYDELLFQQTKPKLNELILSLLDIVPQVPWMPIIKRYMIVAHHDFDISVMYAHSQDYASAVLYQSYSLIKVHSVLENLTRMASHSSHNRFSSFNEKKAYGYDISGEVFEGSGELANRENQKNIDDTAQPQDHHETPPNPLNLTRDSDADKEFPELSEKKNKKVIWPARTR